MGIAHIRISMEWSSVTFDWNRARAFLVTAEEGSLSRAASALGTTQPTLSRQVAALEEELGVTLFERVGKGMVLTAAGDQLLDHARGMGDAASGFSLAASGQSQCLEGPVRISASEIDALLRMPDIIKTIQRLEPGIQIELVATNEPSDLKRREADIAIRSFRPTQGDLIAKKLCDEPIWFYGAKEYLSQFAGVSTEELFSRIRIIGFEQSEMLVETARRAGWLLDGSNIAAVTSSHMVHWQLVKQGVGLSLFPEKLGDSEEGLQIARPELGPVLTLPLWLVSHRELRTNPRVRRVFAILEEHLSR